MPAQQGSRRDKPRPTQLGGQQPAQRAEKGSVDPRQRGVWIVAAKWRPSCRSTRISMSFAASTGRAAPASSARGRASSRRVEEPRPAIMLGGRQPVTARSTAVKALIKGRDTVLGTHTHAQHGQPVGTSADIRRIVPGSCMPIEPMRAPGGARAPATGVRLIMARVIPRAGHRCLGGRPGCISVARGRVVARGRRGPRGCRRVPRRRHRRRAPRRR